MKILIDEQVIKQALKALEAREKDIFNDNCIRGYANKTNFRPSAALTDLRSALDGAEKVAPVAWVYELATHINEKREYKGWRLCIDVQKPTVPAESIRNLQPLYTAPPTNTDELREAARAVVEWFKVGDGLKNYDVIDRLRKAL